MKNNIKFIILVLKLILLFSTQAMSNDQFNFDITEVEILEEGNKFKGIKRGTVTTDSGIIIDADEFDYDKILNILNGKGNIKIIDTINFYTIFTEKITYLKNQEKFFTHGNSKAINDGVIITADQFNYDKNLNVFNAKENVKIDDTIENVIIFADDMTYQKNQEIILTEGYTEANIEKKYNFLSSDVLLDRNTMQLSSNNKTEVSDDNLNLYELDVFKYYKNDNLLKGKNVKVTSNNDLSKKNSDKYFFSDGFFDLKNNNFTASDTEILMHKDLFGNEKNDPRINGVSSFKKNDITQINKGIFTSCEKNDNCPPWSIQAEKIIHDKVKKQLTYNNALLKIYDVPVVYFPKFFHPDPTVIRQSGLLKPQLNQSQILGTSIQVPYYHVISNEKDITIRPNIFDNHIFMLQSEYRQKTKYSSLLADFAFTKGYKSSLSERKKSLSHLFTKYNLDLNLDNFVNSNLNLNIEKVTNDTYLKVFDSNLLETAIKPSNKDKLSSSIALTFDHKDFSFSTGATSYEKLTGKNSDRYQFVLPYYDFSKNLFMDSNIGSLSFNSSGSNNLKDTNNLRSRIVNDLSFDSFDLISNQGLKNNFSIYFKNLNTLAKNDTLYKSSPQLEIMSILEARSSLPLIKYGENYDSYFEPKISFRFNPGDMKDYSADNRKISASNIFDINRLGLTDTFEEGKSLTIGIDYKKENIEDINKYFEFKIASVFRDNIEEKIPTSSAIKQSGNLIGSMKNNINKNFDFIYDFSIDNDLKTIEYNSIGANLFLNKFTTGIKFIEENGKIGNSNSIENTILYTFDENNFLSFNTRRNRTINLTEYYDLLYEYKNDCLIAGVKYKKTYYKDRDVLPTEDLMLSITIFPLTTYEKSFDRGK
tara:strand:- start:1576 stop:4197 length:2622 start_codon:yes stop_codon:yes gene_type:complete